MEEKNGLDEVQAQEECKTDGEPVRSSQGNNYWGDDLTEALIGLDQIKALADLMTETITDAIHSFSEQYPECGLF